MKYISKALPRVTPGLVITDGFKRTVPDQGMTLQEILQRFTRGEAIEAGKETYYADVQDVDLEKASHMDLSEKTEFIERQKEIRKDFEREEKAREKAAKKAAEEKLKADKSADPKKAE